MKKANAQVSVEVIVAVSVLLLTLILVFFYTSIQNERINELSSTSMQKNDCSKIVSAISMVNSNSENSQIEIDLGYAVTIENHFINFENYYCEFYGAELTATLAQGRIIVKKENGVVSIENL